MTYLEKILVAHREAALNDDRSLDAEIDQAMGSGRARGFSAALASAAGSIAVISEIKRRSPSKGALNLDLDPAALAQAYQSGGAACLSVLTDTDFFGGSVGDLHTARSAVKLPVLRKDFTVSALDVVDTKKMGADAVLLIVAALDDAELTDFLQLARTLGLDALVETHDENEVERALSAGATLVGVNQRDLVTFEVDTERAVRIGQELPDEVFAVAESGISGPEDVPALRDAGYGAVLVGESLVRSGDPAEAVAKLRTA